MRNLTFMAVILLCALVLMPQTGVSAEEVVYDFEEGLQEWIIPEWAYDMADHICKNIQHSKDVAKGDYSLKLNVDFPGEDWYASVIEAEGPFDWSQYNLLSCDIYLPRRAPPKMVARCALIVGKDWLWIESTPPVSLVPGKWTTLTGILESGKEKWKRTKMVERIGKDGKIRGHVQKSFRIPMTDEYKTDIHILVIRIEANWIEYKGPVYIDNIRLTK